MRRATLFNHSSSSKKFPIPVHEIDVRIQPLSRTTTRTRTRTIDAGCCWRSRRSRRSRSFSALLAGKVLDYSPSGDAVTLEPALVDQQGMGYVVGKARDRRFIAGFH